MQNTHRCTTQPEETGTPYQTCDTCKCLYSSGCFCCIPLWREEGRKTLGFFFSFFPREGGAIYEVGTVSKVTVLRPTDRSEELTFCRRVETHTHREREREREGKLLLRLSWGRDLLVRSELVETSCRRLCADHLCYVQSRTRPVGDLKVEPRLFLYFSIYTFWRRYRWYMVSFVQCYCLIVCMWQWSWAVITVTRERNRPLVPDSVWQRRPVYFLWPPHEYTFHRATSHIGLFLLSFYIHLIYCSYIR